MEHPCDPSCYLHQSPYVLVDEGLKQPVADRKPQDGAVIMREWLDYAAGRVPQVQVDKIKQAGARGLSLSFSEAARGIGPQPRIVQHPRVFYRRKLEAQPLVVAKPGVRVAASRSQ